MPTRKQRRRREKSFRHEWEYVEVDPETGEERQVDPAELKPEKPEKVEAKPAHARGKQPGKGAGRGRREPPPPSWQRVWKRTAMFAPVFALFIYWTGHNSKSGVSALSIAVSTVVLVAFFAPFSYLVDTMTYRMWLKRSGAQGQPPAKKKR
jgi:hypothetical protein